MNAPDPIQDLTYQVLALTRTVEILIKRMPPALVTIQDAAIALKMSVSTVRRMIRDHKLASVTIGKSVRVDLSQIKVSPVKAA